MDGEGRRIARDLPGRPEEIRSGLAILTSSFTTAGDGAPSFTVHRVRD